MMKITVAAAVAESIAREGVRRIFGYPGAAICPFYDILPRYTDKFEHVLVRHEANAGHAANGYARITGRPAVCVATSGPGATNLITAIATAYMDSVPVVAITGQVNSDQIGRDVFQEADITGAVEPFVKHSYLVKEASEIAVIMKSAFYIAGTGRPGPVLIDIPMDVLKTKIEFEYPDEINISGYNPNSEGHPGQIKRAAHNIRDSKRPLICAGGGILTSPGAKEQLNALAEKINAPVVTTLMGISAVPHDSELYYGMIGMHGRQTANEALNKCDLLMLFGARVGDRALQQLKSTDNHDSFKVIHADIDPAEIGKNISVDTKIVGDASGIIHGILNRVPEQKHNEWIKYLDGRQAEEIKRNSDNLPYAVNPKAFIELLSTKLPPRAVIAADVGQNQIWTANHIFLPENGRFITSGGMGTMGYSLPAAIGAKAAEPDRVVIAICGDGSFQMQFMELATMVQHGINVKVVVMVNNRLGMVRELQDMHYKCNKVGVFLDGSPDFTKIADAYGIKSGHITDIAHADAELSRFIENDEPYLLAVDIPQDAKTIL
ncbi:acetolactate synthase [Clostridia bacterium]|nr:acetolactate synthase [Clostridia bacterium]